MKPLNARSQTAVSDRSRVWWNFTKRKERRAGIVLTTGQRAVFDEATQLLRDGLPIERVVFYAPDDEDVAKDPSTLHIAVITDHYPSDKEYRAALDVLSSVAARHNVNIRPLFATCKDWEEYFPLVAAFKQIQQEGVEVWRRT
ncbi:MAG: hypothetical protein ACREV4_05090 [Gammaproteobacteria bacterium]